MTISDFVVGVSALAVTSERNLLSSKSASLQTSNKVPVPHKNHVSLNAACGCTWWHILLGKNRMRLHTEKVPPLAFHHTGNTTPDWMTPKVCCRYYFAVPTPEMSIDFSWSAELPFPFLVHYAFFCGPQAKMFLYMYVFWVNYVEIDQGPQWGLTPMWSDSNVVTFLMLLKGSLSHLITTY